jgi:hypothetical protein
MQMRNLNRAATTPRTDERARQGAEYQEDAEIPDHDAVMRRVEDHVRKLGNAIDEFTFTALDELFDSWVTRWITRVDTEHTRHHAEITKQRDHAKEELAKAKCVAEDEKEELARIEADYLQARSQLHDEVPGYQYPDPDGDDGDPPDVVIAASIGSADPELLSGQGRGYVAGAGVLIVIGATTDTIAFRNTLEVVLRTVSGQLAWLMAAGATSMALIAAASLGTGLARRRRGNRRALLTVYSTLSVWLCLGLSMFLVRWLDADTVNSAFGGQQGTIQATPLVASFFGSIYLISGACTIFEAERLYNPEYLNFRKFRKQYRHQVLKAAEAESAQVRAASAVDDAEDEFRREDERRGAKLATCRALGEEAKRYARFLMSVILQNPGQTYVPTEKPPAVGQD